MKLRILAISDTHGSFPELHGHFDCVVHSGDFLQEFYVPSGNKARRISCQFQWLNENMENIRKWLQGKPLLFVPGNHDWLEPQLIEQELNLECIKAINLQNKTITYQEITFYGFPYVPAINGMYNYELELPEMTEEVDEMVRELQRSYVEVIVAHAPIHGTLDLTQDNQRIGSTVIANALDYKLDKNMLPLYYLHGHNHYNGGIAMRNGMLVSNAAYRQNIIEI